MLDNERKQIVFEDTLFGAVALLKAEIIVTQASVELIIAGVAALKRIEGAANPFGPTFDAAMVWGPVYGRLTYAGLRYRIE